MKWKEKFSDYFWRLLKWMTPETETDIICNEIKKLDENNPENFGKLALMNLKLSNGYAMMLGRTNDDVYNHFMVNLYYDTYKLFREKWVVAKN
jgi:hypothetical protein